MLRQPRPEGPPPSVEELQAVILDITADVPHVFQSFVGGPLNGADQALDRAALFISQHIPAGTATAPAQAN
jgi:monoterpene epsilon-lactone hydrolase